jgi:hypothetical protein
MVSYELKSQNSVTARPAPDGPLSVRERDDANLQRIGKKPVLKVRLPYSPDEKTKGEEA